MTGRRLLSSAALLVVLFAHGVANADGNSVNNTGSCDAITQGNGNTVTVICSDPVPSYPPEPRYAHVWQSPDLGIGIEQDGKWVPLYTTPDDKKLIVDLAPKPFIVWVPDDHWTDPGSDLPALQISISWDATEFDKPSSHLFQSGTGFADTLRGSGWLILADPNDDFPGHNYIIDHRFNQKMKGWRGFFVSMIGLPRVDRNMISAGEVGYAVFMMHEEDGRNIRGVTHVPIPIDEAPRDNMELVFGHAP